MKNGYRYYQRGEKLPWIAIPAENAEAIARSEGAVRLTVLTTSKLIGGLDSEDAGPPPKDMRFFGPMYFDIDHKGDLPLAIESTNRLVSRLHDEYGVALADIDVFLSGSKGLHVFLPPSAFGLQKPVLRLPQAYKEMAKQLYVSGLDLQPYSTRNAFRLPNVQRDDGKFRVQITIDELRTLTKAKYEDLVAQPRHGLVLPEKTGAVYTQLSVLFDASVEMAKKAEKPVTDNSQILNSVLKQHFAIEPPPCMQHLAEGKRAESASFNQMATQVAIFAARLGPDGMGTFEPMFNRIADNQSSSNYGSSRLRMEHMQGLYHYMQATPRFTFSCNAVRSVLRSRVCDECPLEAVKVVDSPETAAEAVGLAVRADGYFDTTTPNKPRRVSTFVLEPKYVFNEHQDNGQTKRVGTYVSVMSNGTEVGQVILEEQAWSHRQSFLKALQGYSNLSFLGSDTDIQKIKYVTMAENDLPEKQIVREFGLHVQKINGKEVRTYVEKGRSINSLKIPDTMTFEGHDLYAPFLLNTRRVNDAGDEEARLGLLSLLRMNEPFVSGALVGWAAACHLKSHLMHQFHEFPPVNLWGPSGSGKTTFARCVLLLGGVNFLNQYEELNVPGTSPFAWLESLSNSTSIPILWDELNKSQDRMPAKMFAKACELLKATFNGQALGRGALGPSNAGRGGSSAVVMLYKMVRPVLFCSEQQPDLAALNDRSVNLFVTKAGKEGRRQHLSALKETQEGVQRLATTLLLTALNTPSASVRDLLEESLERIPERLSERPRYGLSVCAMGLRWLRQVIKNAGTLDDELDLQIEECISAIEAEAHNLAAEENSRQVSSEVDRVFGDIFEIVAHGELIFEGLPGVALMHPGVHFEYRDISGFQLLYLDVRTCHTAYQQWCRSKGTAPVLDDLRNFIKLSKHETYVRGLTQSADVLSGKHAICIDLAAARKRGLPVNMLKGIKHEQF